MSRVSVGVVANGSEVRAWAPSLGVPEEGGEFIDVVNRLIDGGAKRIFAHDGGQGGFERVLDAGLSARDGLRIMDGRIMSVEHSGGARLVDTFPMYPNAIEAPTPRIAWESLRGIFRTWRSMFGSAETPASAAWRYLEALSLIHISEPTRPY